MRPPDFAKVGFQTEFAVYVPVLITCKTYCMLIWTNITYFNTHFNTDVWVLKLCYEFPAGAKKNPLLSFNARSLRSFLKMKERAARWREKSITRALSDARSPRVSFKKNINLDSNPARQCFWLHESHFEPLEIFPTVTHHDWFYST
jgi:hypothetical protein